MGKFTWVPSVTYTFYTICISAIVGALIYAVLATILSSISVDLNKNVSVAIYITSTFLFWLFLICIPEETEI